MSPEFDDPAVARCFACGIAPTDGADAEALTLNVPVPETDSVELRPLVVGIWYEPALAIPLLAPAG
jgi:hypothetical protein